MKRKTRFNDGGMNRNPYQGDDIDPFSAMRDEEGGTARGRDLRAEIAAMQERPTSQLMFDETTGKELGTRRNLETGEYYSTEPIEAPKAPVRAARKAPQIKDVPGSGRGTMAGRRAIDDIMRDAGGGGRGRSMGRTAADVDTFTPGKTRSLPSRVEIPGTESRGDSIGKTRGEQIQDEMSDNAKKALMALGLTSGAAGILYGGKRLMDAKRATEVGKEAAKAFTKPQAREVGSKVPARPSQASKERAEALEKAKPILQSRPDTKAARASRTRRTEEDAGIEFSKGGSASRRADGCATRGKTRGKIY